MPVFDKGTDVEVLPGTKGNMKTGKKPLNVWPINIALIIAIAAWAMYEFNPSIREKVNAQFPWMARTQSQHVAPQPAATEIVQPAETPEPVVNSLPASTPEETPVAVEPTPTPGLDIESLSTMRDKWPKSVALKKPMDFPAVVNGKIVGSVHVPAGSEANLVAIKNGMLGLEYHGGGGWHAPDETDVLERAQR